MKRSQIFESVANLSDALTTALPKPMMAFVTYSERNAQPWSIEITIWPDEILKSKGAIRYFSYYFDKDSSVEFIAECIIEQQRKVMLFVDNLLNGQEDEQ